MRYFRSMIDGFAITNKALLCFLTIATLLPLLPVGTWAVRLFDFPRIQIVVLLLVTLLGLFLTTRTAEWSIVGYIFIVINVCAISWQLTHIVEYTPLWSVELEKTSNKDERTITVSTVNLQFENENKDKLVEQLSNLKDDILLLIEVDESWKKALDNLKDKFPYREGVVREKGLGIIAWSKIPFIESETKHLVKPDRASVFAKLKVSETQIVNFIGVHPTPPGLEDEEQEDRHDSRIRDAELMLVARYIADRPNQKWIVTGDFNDVAWSHTTRVFKRISGLKDPRVGRGLFNTYNANSWLLRFPIDQIFLSPGSKISELNRFHPSGSDHFAITTSFTLEEAKKTDPDVKGNDLKDAKKMIKEGKKDAEKRAKDKE